MILKERPHCEGGGACGKEKGGQSKRDCNADKGVGGQKTKNFCRSSLSIAHAGRANVTVRGASFVS